MSDDTMPTNTDPSVDRFALLDLDLPDSGPVLPAWAANVIAAIRAIVLGLTVETADAAFQALALAIEPARAQPDGPARLAVRTAKDAKLTEINAVRRAALAARVAPKAEPATPAPTVEQPIPVIATAPAAPREFSARWAKLPDGEWGARLDIPSTHIGTTVTVGDVINVRNAAGTSVKRLHFVSKASNGICVVSKDPPSIPPAALAAASALAATMAPAADVEALAESPAAAEPTLTQALGAIASEASANANAGTQGSMAGGQMAGVGYTTAEGYTRALANGVKAATAEEYKRILRGTYGYSSEQIAALTVSIIAESTLPVGPGIAHVPTGPSYADMTPAQRRAVRRVGEETRAKVKALLDEGQLIAGAVAAGSALQVSWTGAGTTTLGKVRAALAQIGREHDAPSAPSAVRHAGRAVDSLRSSEWDTARLPSAAVPNGTKAQWVVGTKISGRALQIGEGYNKAALIVSLSDSDVLTFEGDAHLAARVREHYHTATAEEILKSEDLTAWLGDVLYRTHYAVKRGHLWYVPGGQADAARLLTETIGTLWGDHERIPVTSGPDLMRALTRGLNDECAAIEAGLVKDTDAARTRAREAVIVANAKQPAHRRLSEAACEAEAELAAKRAHVSPVVAARIMTELAGIAARVDGYTMVLGEDATKAVKSKLAALRDQVEPYCTDGALRASMLELT